MQRALEQFPDYPAADLPPLPEGWEDISWRNDMCPCYSSPNGFGVWLDYAAPEQREFPELPRWTVFDLEANANGRTQQFSKDFDTWESALAFVQSATDGLPADVCASFETIQGAVAWIVAMHRAGLEFHWEDSAHSIIWVGDSSLPDYGKATFTEAQAVLINARRLALYSLDWPEGTCPCGVSLAIGGHFADNVRLASEDGTPEDVAAYSADVAKYARLFPDLPTIRR